MITAYTGRPGNGKSYHAALDIYRKLRAGKNIITNIRINLSFRHKGRYIYVSSEDMAASGFCKTLLGYSMEWHKWTEDGKTKEGQTLLIIDEAQQDDLLNCRTWQNKTRKEWNDFFSLHRHYGFNVILVTQDLVNLDKQTQKLIQNNVEHRKFSNFNPWTRFISKLVFHEMFICIERDQSLKRSPKAARMGSYTLWSHRKIYDLYNSFNTSEYHLLSKEFIEAGKLLGTAAAGGGGPGS